MSLGRIDRVTTYGLEGEPMRPECFTESVYEHKPFTSFQPLTESSIWLEQIYTVA